MKDFLTGFSDNDIQYIMVKKQTAKIKETEQIEDIVFEDGSDVIGKKVTLLKKKLRECEKERREYLNGWQRARADAINREKEMSDEKIYITARVREEMIVHLFPILDSFDMAFSNKKAWSAVDENWRVGVEHIYSQVLKILEAGEVEIISPLNEKFNPKMHEPMEIKEVHNKKDDDKVLQVTQKGYRVGERVLRPAKVVIGKLNK